MVKIIGDEIATALRSWVTEDIKESPRLSHDLGKFFFTVSIGTVAAVTALVKYSSPLKITWILGCSFAVLLVSLVMALWMVVPKRQMIDADTDLQQAYQAQVRRIIRQCRAWFALWFLGTALGGWAVFSASAATALPNDRTTGQVGTNKTSTGLDKSSAPRDRGSR